MNFSCDLGVSIQDNDTFMRGSCLSNVVRNVIVCYQAKRLPSDMLYVHENVVYCFSILASLNSIRQSEVLQMLHQCAVLTPDILKWLVIVPANGLNAEFHVDITIHMAIYGEFVKIIEIKVASAFSVGEGSSFLIVHTFKTTII